MRKIRIGRGSDNDIVINDEVVSSFHAVITLSDFGEVVIEDQNSKNGTFVDGNRITKSVLTSSSTVLLGNHSIDWKQIILLAKNAKTKTQTPVILPNDVVESKLIGRNPSSQIRYSFDDVSDKHAYLCRKSNGEIILVDNNSTNGTYVNGLRITTPYTLRKGDNVAISNKHPLNWESVYPYKSKKKIGLIISSIAAIIILLVTFFVVKPWNFGDKDWSVIYEEHKNDVVLIYLKSAYVVTAQGEPISAYIDGVKELDYFFVDEEGGLNSGIAGSSGTGFFISPDGKLLTNRHVVSSSEDVKANETKIEDAIKSMLIEQDLTQLANDIEVNYTILSLGIAQNDTYIDNESNLLPCTILKVSDNEELDVAILQTNTKSIPSGSTFVDLSNVVPSEKLSLGYEICTIGFPKSFIIGQTQLGLEANNQSGEITQERGAYQYGHNITIHQGASGSPVYDHKGRFAGIIVSGFLGISQGYNHAINPLPVVEFVNEQY